MRRKEIERAHVERLLNTLGMPSGPLLRHSESPDFILRHVGRAIGIEHTQFFFPAPEGEIPQQQIEGLQRLAVEEAGRIFRSTGGAASYVSPIFNDRRAPRTKRKAYELGRQFAATVAANGVPPRGQARTHETWKVLPAIHCYTVMRSVDGVDELWSGGSGGCVATVAPDHVQRVLDVKAPKYRGYLRSANAVWLLVVNDVFRGGSPCEIGGEAMEASYSYPFERAFWLETAGDRLVELLQP